MKYFGKKDYWRPNNLFDSIFLGISLSVLANMASGFETSPLFLFSLLFVIIAVVLTMLYLYHKNNVATDIENELHRALKGMAERDSAPRDNGQTVDKSESDSHEIKETESHISPIEYANKEWYEHSGCLRFKLGLAFVCAFVGIIFLGIERYGDFLSANSLNSKVDNINSAITDIKSDICSIKDNITLFNYSSDFDNLNAGISRLELNIQELRGKVAEAKKLSGVINNIDLKVTKNNEAIEFLQRDHVCVETNILGKLREIEASVKSNSIGSNLPKGKTTNGIVDPNTKK